MKTITFLFSLLFLFSSCNLNNANAPRHQDKSSIEDRLSYLESQVSSMRREISKKDKRIKALEEELSMQGCGLNNIKYSMEGNDYFRFRVQKGEQIDYSGVVKGKKVKGTALIKGNKIFMEEDYFTAELKADRGCLFMSGFLTYRRPDGFREIIDVELIRRENN